MLLKTFACDHDVVQAGGSIREPCDHRVNNLLGYRWSRLDSEREAVVLRKSLRSVDAQHLPAFFSDFDLKVSFGQVYR